MEGAALASKIAKTDRSTIGDNSLRQVRAREGDFKNSRTERERAPLKGEKKKKKNEKTLVDPRFE